MKPFNCPVCSKSFRWGSDADSTIVEAEGDEWRSCRENAHWKLTFHLKQEHPEHGFLCPRRAESIGQFSDFSDHWGERDGYRSCSYCGSMHPDDLFACIEAGAHIGGTDKNYKIYVDAPSKNPNEMRIISASNDGPSWGDKDKWQRVTDANRDRLIQEGWRGDYKWFWERPVGATVNLKFYYQHLDDAQQGRFIDLYNTKKINLDQFGLYRTPYFARPK